MLQTLPRFVPRLHYSPARPASAGAAHDERRSSDDDAERSADAGAGACAPRMLRRVLLDEAPRMHSSLAPLELPVTKRREAGPSGGARASLRPPAERPQGAAAVL